jgi:hypothetical protein
MAVLYELGIRALDNHRLLPRPVLRFLLGRALSGSELALCLHRVGWNASDTGFWETMMRAEELDELIELLLAARGGDGSWLTVCFDDGYADAGRYIESRASRFPGVAWLLFVCPEKLTKRAGFRWDLPPGAPQSDVSSPPLDVRTENERNDLRELGDKPDCAIMTVDECRQIAKLPNVFLGNHTNCHFRQTLLTLEDSRYDITKSRRDFEELFGRTDHFAFPFGTPGREFNESHVQVAKELGYTHVWSTEARPYWAEERTRGAIPRYMIFGSWAPAKNALHILMHAMKWRWRSRSAVAKS